MISQQLVTAFTNAAVALANGRADTGYTGNGLKKLDFFVKVPSEDNPRKTLKKVFTAIEQNKDKLSTPAQMAKNGHLIIQIRDVERGILLGNVDVGEKRFNSYESVPTAMDIDDVVENLGDIALEEGEVQVSAARTSSPVDPELEEPAVRKSTRRAA